jgi:putative drug exporter of the RND superfamily
MGLGMIAALIVDASIIRVLLVPAAMRLLGRANWWRRIRSAGSTRGNASARTIAVTAVQSQVGNMRRSPR